ncbi:MAG: hypothetical protein BM562_05375 [Alphaproteobacteria bacterium MedPE-SWcel]|nr:MAG: hypothetical protein BM562_05375 [Alphaproteobacteria bacterium MedPE-SWcel]
MSIPTFSAFPEIPQRSTPEADFDAKMYALFQHFATTHRAELLAFIAFLETNSTVIGAALNDTTIGLTTPAAAKFTSVEVAGSPGVLAALRDGVASNFLVQTAGNKTTIGNAAGSSRLALMAGNQEAIEFDSAGLASGAAVQASATDSAAGKLLRTGAGGLLAANPPSLPDPSRLDVPAGIYSIAAEEGWPFDGALLQLRRNAGRGLQIIARGSSAAPNASSEVQLRTSGDSFGGWARLVHLENLVGAVAQSGGTPTGAVIERGSNANGGYVRFADGTQICISPDFASVDVTTVAGAIYRNAAPLTWTFPATFSGGAGSVAGSVTSMGNSQTHWGSLRVLGFAEADMTVFAPGASTNRTIRAKAIGRWF